MEKAKIFQSIVKGSNFFTPIVDSYHTIVEGNVIETKSKYPINVFENESSKKVSK